MRPATKRDLFNFYRKNGFTGRHKLISIKEERAKGHFRHAGLTIEAWDTHLQVIVVEKNNVYPALG
jgi:hypothetical protein